MTLRLVHPVHSNSDTRQALRREFEHVDPAVNRDDHAPSVPDTLTYITNVLSGHRRATGTLASRVAIIITTSPALRDAMLPLLLNDPDAGASLWTRFARQLRSSARVEALTIAGCAYCLAGDNVRAAIACELAIAEAAEIDGRAPRLADLIVYTLDIAVDPNAAMRHAILASQSAT